MAHLSPSVDRDRRPCQVRIELGCENILMHFQVETATVYFKIQITMTMCVLKIILFWGYLYRVMDETRMHSRVTP